MKNHTTTGILTRIWPKQDFGTYSHIVFSIINEEKQTLYFKLQQFKTGGNIGAIKAFTIDDKIKVEYYISCKVTKTGYPVTDLLIRQIEMIDPAGADKETRRKKTVERIKNKRNIHRINTDHIKAPKQ